MSGTFRWCVGCASEQQFEMPPCEDEHGADCLDLACVQCGHAVVTGVLLTPVEVVVEVRAA